MRTLATTAIVLAATVTATTAVAGDDANRLVRHAQTSEFLSAAHARGIDNLLLEDFEDSFARFLPDSEFAACVEPVSNRSNDACFEPGGLPEGMRLSSSHLYGVIVLGKDLLDTTSLVAGAWPYRLLPSSLNFTRVDFDDGPTFVAADVYGFRITSGTANGLTAPVLVEAFDTGGELIGSFTVEPGAYNQPAFVGFDSPVPIGQVQFGTREEAAGEMIDNLRFGGGPGRLAASPARLRFGTVAIDNAAALPVTLTNAGYLDLVVGQLPDPGAPFLREDDGCSGATLAPGQQCTVWFAMAPDHADDYRAEFEVPVDEPSRTVRLRLSGTGIAEGGAQ